MQSGRDEDIREIAIFTATEAAFRYEPGDWEEQSPVFGRRGWHREGRGNKELWLQELTVDPVIPGYSVNTLAQAAV